MGWYGIRETEPNGTVKGEVDTYIQGELWTNQPMGIKPQTMATVR